MSEINFIFVVDLYNEGVDIPEVDTVLFLRPTESLTVYLQQLGRGLRLSDGKETLTVLDFIGAQRREFRFADRFRALSTRPTSNIQREIEHDFPHLPSGCFVQLEKVARQRVLENVSQSMRLLRPRMVGELRSLGRMLGRVPTMKEALNFFNIDLETLLKKGSWSRLLADANLQERLKDPDGETLAKGLRRLWHVNDFGRLNAWQALLQGDDADSRFAHMLHATLWGSDSLNMDIAAANRRLLDNPGIVSDLLAMIDYQKSTAAISDDAANAITGPLRVGAVYSTSEVLCGLGHWTIQKRPSMREGTLHLADQKLDASFITLQKTESDYSPTTMYEDYFISQDLFHWQSQSRTSVESPTGQRYIHHQEQGYTPLLFVRDTRNTVAGNTSPYHFLGPCDHVSHEGSRPISITWKLRNRVAMPIYRKLNQQVAG